MQVLRSTPSPPSIPHDDRRWSGYGAPCGDGQAKPDAGIERPDFAPLGPVPGLGRWTGVATTFNDERLFLPDESVMSSRIVDVPRHAAALTTDHVRIGMCSARQY